MTQNLPKTLIEAVTYFEDKNNAVEYFSKLRWPDGVTCQCGSKNVTALKNRPLWQCKDCRKQFSAKQGTVMEDSPIPLSKWLVAMWQLGSCRNGISSCELARVIGVSQHSCWFMLHRIREGMRNGSIEKLSGTVESDSTYIGGAEKNRHNSKKKDAPGGGGKAIVFGVVERGGKVHSQVVEGTGVQDSENDVLTNVTIGSRLFTDEAPGYRNMHYIYDHATVNHSKGQYVVGEAHTNTIENYWSLVKRMIKGTYIHVEPFHLDRYLDEQGLRYNLRKRDEQFRLSEVATGAIGKRLTWKELTGTAS